MEGDTAQSQGAVPSEATEPAEGQQPQPNQQHEGFQKRIDELTAARREAERQVAEVQARLASRDEQMMNLVQRLAQLQAEPAVQAPQQLPEVPPELKQILDAYALNPIAKRLESLEKMLSQTQQFSGMQMELMQMEQMAAQQRAPAEVVQEAKARVAQWRKQGIPANVAGADAALQMAWGSHAMRALSNPPAPVANPPPQPTGSAHAFPAGGGGAQPVRPPPNFDKLTVDQQLAWFEKNGYGDKPLW